MNAQRRRKLSPATEIACISIMAALLIGGQYALSFVAGVEIVTLLIICFSYVFGARSGVICAIAFSLLRCLLFGFYPTVMILYLIYYPLLAAIFGGLGHIKESTFENYPVWFALIVNLLLLGVASACATAYLLNLIKLSRIIKATMYALLWVIFALCAGLCIAFDVLFVMKKAFKKNTQIVLKLITLVSIAAICTISFSLLDDVITPLFWGYDADTALAYFYTSFTAMLPQTVCTIVTVSTLFLPVTSAMRSAVKL